MGFSDVSCLDKTSLSEQGEYGGLKSPKIYFKKTPLPWSQITAGLWQLEPSAGHKQTYGSATLEQKDDSFLASRNYLFVQTALDFLLLATDCKCFNIWHTSFQ